MTSTNLLPLGITDLPFEFPSIFSTLPIDENETFKNLMFSYQTKVIQNTSPYTLGSISIHPDFPYITLFSVHNPAKDFTWNSLWFLWYLLAKYTVAIKFPVSLMLI